MIDPLQVALYRHRLQVARQRAGLIKTTPLHLEVYDRGVTGPKRPTLCGQYVPVREVARGTGGGPLCELCVAVLEAAEGSI